MERTIKFKAKRLDNGEWVEGDLLHKGEEVLIRHTTTIGGEEHIKSVLVDPSTVCQFTGLKDKEGVEIWEGDYLKPIYENYKPMKVVHKYGSFGLDVCYRGLELAPLACCDIREDDRLVELELVDRKEGEK